MSYRNIDEVTADCLAEGDLIQIEDASTSETVYLLIDTVEDKTDEMVIEGRDIDDTESEFRVTLDPESRVELYMDIDDED